MDRRGFTLAALLALLVFAGPGHTGIGIWTTDGTPYMCYDVTDVAVGRAPGAQYPIVYAADTVWHMSLFKSTNEGEIWSSVQPSGVYPFAVTCEAQNPANIVFDKTGILC